MKRQFARALVAGTVLACLAAPALAAPPAQAAPTFDLTRLLATSMAWFIPAGLILLAAAGVPQRRAWQTALAGVAGSAIGVLAFAAVGFALAFGGIGLVYDQAPHLSGLVWEWTLMTEQWGPGWGMVGLSGWGLTGPAATPGAFLLFLAQAPWVATAATIPLLALRGRSPALTSLLGGLLVGGLLYPLATNWVWGGGWLANLGINMDLGHGFVDFAGAGTVFLVAASAGLAGLLLLVPRRAKRTARADEAIPMPPVHLPLLASVGALLVLAGSIGWAWGNPLLDLGTLWPSRGVVNTLLAASAGALVPLAYTWFVADRPDPLMAARGLAAGAIASMAFGPFVEPGLAALIGLLAGLLTPVLTYLLRETLRVDDDTGLVPVHLIAAVLGLVAVGLFADGLAGQGWNGVGEIAFLGVPGQGVTGWRAAAGMVRDWPGQMQAQLIGVAALFLVPFLAGTLLFGLLAAIAAGMRRVSARAHGPEDGEASAAVVEDSQDLAADEAGEPAGDAPTEEAMDGETNEPSVDVEVPSDR